MTEFSLVSVEAASAAITTIFLLVVASYYVLLLIPDRKQQIERKFSSITVIMPAHNEELHIKEALQSVLDARFSGKKEVIVVEDGSIDRTYEVAASFKRKGVKIIRTKHSGKSASLNRALALAKSDLIAVVDADSVISSDALEIMAGELGKENVAAASCVVKVKNRKSFLGMWLHMEQIYNSLMRSILSKANGNVTTPGPLSMYRRKCLNEIGGFSTEGFSEDVDVTIRLIRKGYKVRFAEKAVSETYMPIDPKGFMRQRTRFARGLLNILKRHLQVNTKFIDIYTLPIFLFTYIQAVVMGSITIHKIISGYATYFASQGTYFSPHVARFFFEWLSIAGFAKWTASVLTGNEAMTFVALVGIASTLLSYPLLALAIIRFDRKIDLWHIIPFFFMFPFWLLVMAIYTVMLPEYFRKTQYNIWKKNE